MFQRVPSRESTPESQHEPNAKTPPLSTAEEGRQSVADPRSWKRTQASAFQFFKLYWTLEDGPPDPDSFISQVDLVDDADDQPTDMDSAQNGPTYNPYHPFPNFSTYMLGQWFWSDREKSRETFQELIGILTNESFKCHDLLLANWSNIQASLSSSQFDSTQWNEDHDRMWVDDGSSWQTSPVSIDVPFNSTSYEPGSRSYTIQGFRFRPLVPLIRAKLQDARNSDYFHTVPYDLRWQPPGAADSYRVYGELYHSSGFLDAYKDIQVLV